MLDGCDAVYVCTWTSEHPAWSRRRLLAGSPCSARSPSPRAGRGRGRWPTRRRGRRRQPGRPGPAPLPRLPGGPAPHHEPARPGDGGRVRDDQFIPIQGHYGRSGGATSAGGRRHAARALASTTSTCSAPRRRIERVSAHRTNFHGHDGIEDVRHGGAALRRRRHGHLTSVWHDNLARPSLRRVEISASGASSTIEGDDWSGPVRWQDADGTPGHPGRPALTAGRPGCSMATSQPRRRLLDGRDRGSRAALLRPRGHRPPGRRRDVSQRRCRRRRWRSRREPGARRPWSPGLEVVRSWRPSTPTTCACGCSATAPRHAT